MNYRAASIIFSINGIVLLLIGFTAAIFAPLEIYCFNLFSEGGRFHYEGFGFGSLMFGFIAVQIAGYYVIAAIFIPLGLGHLYRKYWVQNISLALLGVWWIVGIPLILFLLLTYGGTKEPSVLMFSLFSFFLLFSYTLLPVLLVKFYKSKSVDNILKVEEKSRFLEKIPIPILVRVILYLFYFLGFHLLLLFRGIFPFFGKWLVELPGFFVITLSILFMVILIVGTLRLDTWAKWVSVAYFSLFAISTILTFLFSEFSEVIFLLKLPPKEVSALINSPIENYHLCLVFGVPMLASVGTMIFFKNTWKTDNG